MAFTPDALVSGFLEGSTLQIRTTMLPPVTVELSPTAPSGPVSGAISKVMKPKLVFLRNGQPFLNYAPWGEPSDTAWRLPVFLAMALLVLLIVLK